MDIKAIFFDIDWTIYDHKNLRFAPGSIRAIKKCQELHPEIKLFLCTARPYDSFRRLGVLDLGIYWEGYVASAGSLAYGGGTYIHKDTIDEQTARQFIASCQKRSLTCEIVEPLTRIRQGEINDIAKRYYSIYREVIPDVKKYQGEEVCLFNLFSEKDTDEEMKKENPNLLFYRYCDVGSDVVSAPHDKGPTLEKVLSHYGIKKEEAVGFGDDIQDISLAQHVGTFIAMGNAKEEVKKIAQHICPPCWEDGIEEGLFYLSLIPLPK